jgi:hypothetical protein
MPASCRVVRRHMKMSAVALADIEVKGRTAGSKRIDQR